jgi:DNA-binding NarL/FixJ family response regulator
MERRKLKANSGLITSRERRILILLAEGYPNEEIARRLAVPLKALQEHLDHLRHKFKATSGSTLISFALNTGLINCYEVLESRFAKAKRSKTPAPFHTSQGAPE